jgi:hypothetical protein
MAKKKTKGGKKSGEGGKKPKDSTGSESEENSFSGKRGNSDLRKHAKSIVATDLWRQFKFVPEQPQKEEQFCEMVCDILKDKGFTLGRKSQWVSLYKTIVSSAVSEQRNYVVSQMKNACKKYWESNNKTLPKSSDIQECATRNLDLKEESDYKIYDWYWNQLLPAVAGNANDWNEDKRFFGTISESAAEDGTNKLLMTVPNEAFAVLAYTNYSSVWQEQWKIQAEHPGKTISSSRQVKTNFDQSQGWGVDGKKLYLFGRKFRPQWAGNDSGSNRSGGWNRSGKKKYLEFFDLVKNSREIPQNVDMEREYLKRLREKEGITATNPKDHRESLKKRKQVPEEGPTDYDDPFDKEFAQMNPTKVAISNENNGSAPIRTEVLPENTDQSSRSAGGNDQTDSGDESSTSQPPSKRKARKDKNKRKKKKKKRAAAQDSEVEKEDAAQDVEVGDGDGSGEDDDGGNE